MAKKRSVGISLPEPFYDWIKSRASMNCRSFAQEVEFLLEAARGAELNEQLETLRAFAKIESITGG